MERMTTPWWMLRVALGAAAFLTSLAKFFNLLADWPAYLSPFAAHTLARLSEVGVGATASMRQRVARAKAVTA